MQNHYFLPKRIQSFLIDLLVVFWFVRQGTEFIFGYLGIPHMDLYVNILFTVLTYTTSVAGMALSLKKDLIKEAYFIVTGLVILLALNYIIYPENISAIKTITRMTVTTLPCYILVRSIPDAARIIRIMDHAGCVIILFVTYIQAAGLNMAVDNYLTVSYSILPCMIVLIGLLYQEFRLRRIFFVITGLFTLIVYGGRLPLLLLALTVIMFEIKAYMKKKNRTKMFLKYIGLSVVILLITLNINQIKLFVLQKYETQNTYSRMITRIFEANLLDLSGRDYLYESSLKLIKKNPVLGNGIGADAVMIIKERLYDPDYVLSNGGGLNTHNGILEFALEFGVAALAVAVYLLWRGCVRAFQRVDYNYDFIFFALLLGLGIFRTILGYPYWYNHAFWMGIAWCVNICRQYQARNTARTDINEYKGDIICETSIQKNNC